MISRRVKLHLVGNWVVWCFLAVYIGVFTFLYLSEQSLGKRLKEGTPIEKRLSIDAQNLVNEALTMCGDIDCQDPARAIDLLSIAIELAPDFSRTYFHRGAVYFNLKIYTMAVKDFTTAVELDTGKNKRIMGLNRARACAMVPGYCLQGY